MRLLRLYLLAIVALGVLQAGIAKRVLAQGEPAIVPTSLPASVERPSIAGRRIVKHFDFNEAPLGNYESLPMGWRRHGEAGFPLYLEGKFDRSSGHESPPSFRMDLDGGSIAYHYQGHEISVRTNSDYLVVAWVKTQSLETARAYLTACYLDRKGVLIPGTQRRSNLVGGSKDEKEWQPVTLGLPGNVVGSRYIGVSLWLAQASIWSTSSLPMHAIQKEDVRATAWFDDITVYRLPRVVLSSARAGNVFAEGEPVELRTEVTDPDGLNLTASLVLHDVDGRKVDERTVSIHSDRASGFERCLYPDLPIGIYRAELQIRTGPTLLVRRELRFARTPAPINPAQIAGRRFGIVLSNADPNLLDGQRELLAQLHPEYVKLPVWSLRGGLAETAGLEKYLQAVVDAGAEPVGVLLDDMSPATKPATTQPGGARGLIDLLSQEPSFWRPLIASTWARYAGLISVWQVGQDGDDALANDSRLSSVLPVLRREMTPLMSRPVLATPGSVHQPPPASQPAEYYSAFLPHRVAPQDIERHLQPIAAAYPGRSWVIVEPLPESFPRRLRLFDFARRLAEALFTARNGVFITAPWEEQPDAINPTLHPREDLIVFRTVSDVLGEAAPVSRTVFDGQVRCLTFDRNGRATLFVWDPDAPPEGQEHFLPLGTDAQTVDIWGHRRPVETVGQQQRVVIGPEPMFILNASTWVIEFLRQFHMEPASIEFSYDVHDRQITFRNTYRETIAGMLHLVGPPDWDIRPSKMSFALAPGQEFRQSVSIRFPINAQAGILPLAGDFTIDADHRYHFIAPTWFELALRDIDLQTYTYRTGNRLIVRQTMINRTPTPVHFQGYLLAPGRPRIERTFANFESGQSITKDFILENAGELSGRNIRIGLKEIQGTRVWNRILTVP